MASAINPAVSETQETACWGAVMRKFWHATYSPDLCCAHTSGRDAANGSGPTVHAKRRRETLGGVRVSYAASAKGLRSCRRPARVSAPPAEITGAPALDGCNRPISPKSLPAGETRGHGLSGGGLCWSAGSAESSGSTVPWLGNLASDLVHLQNVQELNGPSLGTMLMKEPRNERHRR